MGVVIDFVEHRLRRQQEQRRDEKGRFAGGKTPEGILVLIRRAAEQAHASFPNRCRDPLRCTQKVWQQAAIALEPELGPINQAHYYVEKFQELTGNTAFGWRELLRLAFDEDKDPRMVLGGLTKDAPRLVTVAAAVISVLRIAKSLDRVPRNGVDYETGRLQLLRDDRYRSRGTEHLERVLIPAEDLVREFGSFEAVLELAQLPPSEPVETPRGLSVADGIALYYARVGVLPNVKQLQPYMATLDVALTSLKGKSWEAHIADGLTRIASFPRLPPPPPYGTAANDDWIPIEIDLGELPVKHTRKHLLLTILESVERYVAWLSGNPSRDRLYRTFVQLDQRAVSFNTMRRVAPLADLVAFVSRPNWRDQLDEFDDPRNRSADEIRADHKTRRLKLAQKDDPQKVLEAIEAIGGPVRAQQIAEHLGWTIKKVRTRLALLYETGHIERTEARANSRKQAYRVAASTTPSAELNASSEPDPLPIP